MIRSKRMCNRVIQAICIIMLGLFTFVNTVSAFAIDEKYVGNSTAWSDCDYKVIKDKNFNALLKYIIDEDNACTYFYLFYNYPDSINVDENIIYFTVKIKNSKNSYKITANNNEVKFENGEDINKSFTVSHDFSSIDKESGVGHLYFALQFENKEDKILKSELTCELSVSNFDVITLIDNLYIDLTPPTTAATTKPTTAATTKLTTAATTKLTTAATTKAVTVKETTIKTTKVTTIKETSSTSKNSKESDNSSETELSSTTKSQTSVASTKFEPKPLTTVANKSSSNVKYSTSAQIKGDADKFEPVQAATVPQETQQEDTTYLTDEEFFTYSTQNDVTKINVKRKLSRATKICISIATLLITIGLTLVIIGTSVKKTRNNSDNENEQNKIDD